MIDRLTLLANDSRGATMNKNKFILCSLSFFAISVFSQTGAAARIAYSADGNVHDKDDLCATAMTLSVAAEAGAKNRVVHVDYNNHLGRNGGGQANKHRQNIFKMARHYGYNTNKFFDDRFQLGAAINNLKNEINKSSANNQLDLICAGPMETCWRGINAANPAKRRFVRVISHSRWNNRHADTPQLRHTWNDICRDFDVTCKSIPNQNGQAYKSNVNQWRWLTSKGQRGNDLFNITQVKRGDCSDAGMMHFSVTGNQRPSMNDVRALFN